jgi:hypothetical protein
MQYKYTIDTDTRFTVIFNLKQRQQQIDTLLKQAQSIKVESAVSYWSTESDNLNNAIKTLENQNDVVF